MITDRAFLKIAELRDAGRAARIFIPSTDARVALHRASGATIIAARLRRINARVNRELARRIKPSPQRVVNR